MLVGEEEDLIALLEGPLEDGGRVGGGADCAAVLADEGFERGGGVHVGDRDDAVGVDDLAEVVPGVVDILGLGHVGH